MADGDDTGLIERIDDVLKANIPLVDDRRLTTHAWLRWFYDFRRTVGRNFDTAGLATDQSVAGRIEALEEAIKDLRLREQRQEIEAALAASDLAPAAVAGVSEQAIERRDIEEIRQRVATLESATGAPLAASSLAEALETIREQATADALSLAPAAEMGQLFKPRSLVQWVDPSQMYLPVTQPAIGPNIYETVANGSAWRCFEFAPGTLVTDNDNVLFMATPPDRWDGVSVICRAVWSHPATVTNFLVAWRFQAGQYIDAASGAAALSSESANVAPDIGGITDAIYISFATAVVPANLSPTSTGFAWSPLLFRAGRRNQSEGGTGLAVNARLLGIVLIWGIRPEATS